MDENRTIIMIDLLEQSILWMWIFAFTFGAYVVGWILNKLFKTPSNLNIHAFRWMLGALPISVCYFIS
tara:strand:- start:195 stop:398 length:204 start_codon:yes stop_codon:yes gene_type:complete